LGSVENDPMGSDLDLDLDLDPMVEVDIAIYKKIFF
jgi:hypothetical protein